MRETSNYFDYLFWGSLILMVVTMYTKGFDRQGVSSLGEEAANKRNTNKLILSSVTFWISFGGVVVAIMMSIVTSY